MPIIENKIKLKHPFFSKKDLKKKKKKKILIDNYQTEKKTLLSFQIGHRLNQIKSNRNETKGKTSQC